MAKVKTKAGGAKTASKPASKSAAPPKKAAARANTSKSAPKALTVEERQRLIKPADGYTELADQVVATWVENPILKVPGVSPAKLASAIKRAKKAGAREEAMKRKLEEKLRPLQDGRLQAEHDVWKMVLDAYAVARAQARVAPELGRAFEFLSDALAKRARGKKKPAPSVTPAPAAEPSSAPTKG